MNMTKLSLALFCVLQGCCPSGKNDTVQDSGNIKVLEDDVGVDTLAMNYKDVNVNPLGIGRELADRIIRIKDLAKRKKELGRYGDMLLSVDVPGDYRVKYERFSRLVDLHEIYLDALYRCGVSLESQIDFRLAFLEKIRREIGFQEKKLVGAEFASVAEEAMVEYYLSGLRQSLDVYLWRLESYYNTHVVNVADMYVEKQIRIKIEKAIGRQIRTEEEIRLDRRRPLNKKQKQRVRAY